MLKNKQGGFTLLELLVVITLLALLSVGALVAYDGVGDNASSTAAANNMQTVDRTIRQYNAVTGNYPNQWDSLADANTAALAFDGITQAAIDAETFDEEDLIVPAGARSVFGGWALTDGNVVAEKVLEVLADYGIDELQVVDSTLLPAVGTLPDGAVPNTAHNEGSSSAALEVEAADLGTAFGALSILPAGQGCLAGGTAIDGTFAGTTPVSGTQLLRINAINDFLEDRQCNLILALGFGGDAGKSMQNSSVQMTSAPTFASRTINPARQYGRFIGLFHMGAGPEQPEDLGDVTAMPAGAAITTADQIFDKPRLIAILTPEGKTLDEVLAEATASVE